MSVTYGFYNSKNGDRKYSADNFSELFGCLLSDGIFRGHGGEFEVKASVGDGVNINTSVVVGSGRAWFNGTWTFNDAELKVDVPLSSSPTAGESAWRTHYIVIEVDLGNRVNTIKCVTGEWYTDLNNPKYPTLSRGENGVYQYAIADIWETPDTWGMIENTSVQDLRQGMFIQTSLVSTARDAVSMHRNTFRGMHLGNQVTSDQLAAIRSGNFKDFYVGDYWTVNGVNWRIADIDYWMNTGDPSNAPCKEHHLVVVPDTYVHEVMDLGIISGDSTGKLSKGIEGWNAYRDAKTYMTNYVYKNLLGEGVLPLNLKDYDVSTFSPPTAANHYKANVGINLKAEYMRLLNEPMVFGGYIHAPQGNNRFTFSNTQLALFRLCPEFVRTGYKYWLRDIADVNSLIMVHDSGTSYPANAGASSSTAYFRPVFAIG